MGSPVANSLFGIDLRQLSTAALAFRLPAPFYELSTLRISAPFAEFAAATQSSKLHQVIAEMSAPFQAIAEMGAPFALALKCKPTVDFTTLSICSKVFKPHVQSLEPSRVSSCEECGQRLDEAKTQITPIYDELSDSNLYPVMHVFCASCYEGEELSFLVDPLRGLDMPTLVLVSSDGVSDGVPCGELHLVPHPSD